MFLKTKKDKKMLTLKHQQVISYIYIYILHKPLFLHIRKKCSNIHGNAVYTAETELESQYLVFIGLFFYLFIIYFIYSSHLLIC